MKIIYNNIIPFRGFKAINLFGILFVRKEYYGKINQRTINHERIHTAQIHELYYLPFYLLYIVEWAIRLFSTDDAYRSISFEQEAYINEGNLNYIQQRKTFAFMNYWRRLA